jgi:hypothetical protein
MTLTAELAPKVTASHLERDAYVYVRQSTLTQVREHTESLERQYELAARAQVLGWSPRQVVIVDNDLGRSGAELSAREGFKNLVADVGLGKVGIILGIEVSRLARNNADWYQLLDLCALTDTLIADGDGLYHPADFNDFGWCSASRGRCRRQSSISSVTASRPVCTTRRPKASSAKGCRLASCMTRTAG